MKKSSIILLLIMMMMPSLVFADTSVLTGSQGQIANYNITLNKTSSDIGINTFALLNNNNSIGSSYQNCTITTIVSCQAVFIIQQGSWGRIAVFDNGNLYENIILQNPINYTSSAQSLPKTYFQVGISYLPFAVFIIIGSIISGNIIYYYAKKKEID